MVGRRLGAAGTALAATVLALTACGAPTQPASTASTASAASAASLPAAARPSPAASPVMPDLVGLGMTEASEMTAALDLALDWGRPVPVRCGVQPGTVARQRPAPGTPVAPGLQVRIRPAAIDLARFRGPCPARDLGPVRGDDARLADAFYRFAADPALAAPFADGGLWVGVEGGVLETRVGAGQRDDLAAWQLDGFYAERGGPFSPLDVLAASGGFYELHRGVAPTCGFGDAGRPAELAHLRALSLTAPENGVGACMDWWSVTLFLDDADRIRGVALRLGAP